MTKKIIMVVLAAIFMISMTEITYAADLTKDGETVSVPIKYRVDNTNFVITVPTVIWADKEATEFEITSSTMNLRPDEKVSVYISGGCDENGKITLLRQGSSDCLETYATIGNRSVAENSFRVGLFVDSDESTINTEGKVKLSGLNVDENTRAGDYLTTISFKVELSAA